MSGCTRPEATVISRLNASIRDFAFDALGNYYLTGSFAEPVDFGNGAVPPGRAPAIFIAKYSATGVLDWIKTFSRNLDGLEIDPVLELSASTGLGIDLDGSGNVYVTGELRGAVDFGGGLIGDIATSVTEASTAPANVFIASYEPNGAFRWANVYRSTLEPAFNRGTALAAGHELLYVAGDGAPGLDLGNGTIGNVDGSGYLFLAAFDGSTGSSVWSIGLRYSSTSGTTYGTVSDLELDSQERIYLSGSWRGRLDLGGGEVSSGPVLGPSGNVSEAGFVASYAPANGAVRWFQVHNDEVRCNTNGVAIDESDNVFAIGSFVKSFDLGGGIRESGDDSGVKIFVASYGADGTHRFDITGRTPGGTGITLPTSVTAQGSQLFVSTLYYGPVDVGGGVLTSVPQGGDTDIASSDFALLSYDLRTAEFRWSRHFGTTQLDTSGKVHMDHESPVFAASAGGALDVDGSLWEPLSNTTSVLIRVRE